MLKYKDFVPRQIQAPGIFNQGEHESFDAAVLAVNQWLAENKVQVINLETVVLPNIWSRWEEGSGDAAIGTGGGAPIHWHQFIRCWYYEGSS